MADPKAPDMEVRASLFELQRFLSDQVPPLIFADSLLTLLRVPTEVAMHEIHAWITAQYRHLGTEVPLSDYLFHAIKKIHLVGEFNLVGRERLAEYLEELQVRAIDLCPEEDRELLKRNFSMLGDVPTSLASPVEVLHRQAGTETRLASLRSESGGDATPALRRVSLLLERLHATSGPGAIGFAANREQILSQALTTAVGMARSGAELQESLESVRHLGIDQDPAKGFRLLSQSLPTWAVPMSSIPPSDQWPDSAAPDPIMAMKRIVTMADDPLESARRYRQLVDAAVQWFNEGSLGRAVTMLDIAQRLEEEKAIDPSTAGSVRRSGHEALDQEKLRAFSETKDAHGLMKKILDYFTALTSEGLLRDLAVEQRRDRRRSILALLEVHGEQARAEAIARLGEFPAEKALEGEAVFFVRNLLYVLNRVAPGPKEDLEKEIDVIAGFTAPKHPFLVLKESIAALGVTKHERAVRILARRIAEVETLLTKPAAPGSLPPVQLKQLLDRIAAALSRCQGSDAVRAIVDHGLKGNEQFGDTFGRLSSLASRDLTNDADSLERLVSAIRNELPKRVFGFSMQKSKPRVSKIIEALAGTPAPLVYELLDEIRTAFGDQEYAKSAETVLAAFGSAKAAAEGQHAPGLSGDLEVFGLPNLLESLSSSSATGVLSIFDRNGKPTASISFSTGRVVACHYALLRGRDAVFSLFEEANPGTFAFVSRASVEAESGLSCDVQPLIFEAVRRYDELREARLLVPESVALAATGSKPTPHPDERDAKLVREVWVRASAGEKPSEWKSKISADSYRIWRLLSHWVTTGALRVGT